MESHHPPPLLGFLPGVNMSGIHISDYHSNIYSIPTMAEDSDALTAEFQVVLTQNTLINNIN